MQLVVPLRGGRGRARPESLGGHAQLIREEAPGDRAVVQVVIAGLGHVFQVRQSHHEPARYEGEQPTKVRAASGPRGMARLATSDVPRTRRAVGEDGVGDQPHLDLVVDIVVQAYVVWTERGPEAQAREHDVEQQQTLSWPGSGGGAGAAMGIFVA